MEKERFSRRPGARRAARVLFLLAAFLLLATVTWPGPERADPGPAMATLRIAPVALEEEDPSRRRAGALVFLAGWALDSDEPRFGGISAMHVAGGQVTAISDAGMLLRFAVPGGAGAAAVRIDPLPAGRSAAARKSGRDTEAMLAWGDSAWVGFERRNLVQRYRLPGWTPQSIARPRPMRGWPRNSGPEAIVRLRDGRFLLFAEGRSDGAEHSEALLFDGDPADPATPTVALRYRRLPGYRVTDAALLPDGGLLLLNRRVGWLGGFSAKLAVARADGLGAGATLEPREIAALAAPLTVDNMEALSVTREGDRTIVWIASDDNFTPMQRTLLLKFALVG